MKLTQLFSVFVITNYNIIQNKSLKIMSNFLLVSISDYGELRVSNWRHPLSFLDTRDLRHMGSNARAGWD